MIEPTFGRQDAYDFIIGKAPRLREVWTSDMNLISMIPNGRFVPLGGCWINPDDRRIWPKSRGTSIIVSVKRGSEAYDLRHEAIEWWPSMLTAYGWDYQRINGKIEGLASHRFHLVIENVKANGYFTEKLIDAFATGSVPIYRGGSNIGDFFNRDGMLIVDTMEDIGAALTNATPEVYESMLPAIRENFELSKEYYLAEDYLHSHYNDLLKQLSL